MGTIIEKLDYWVDKNPDKPLFSFLDINGNIIEKYTYAEFSYRSRVISHNLIANYTFKKNDRILLVFPPGIEMICAFFACARIGLIPVPIPPPVSSGFQAAYNKMIYIAKDCDPIGVLTNNEYYWSLKLNLDRNGIIKETSLAKIHWINTGEFLDIAGPEEDTDCSDILFLQYTSGSTSEPKGVMVSHDNLLHNADIVIDHMPVAVTWLPQYHDMGLIGNYLFIALKGGSTYGYSTLDFIRRPSLWLETITKYKGTATSAPNFAFDYCMLHGKIPEQTLKGLDLSTMKTFMTAAEPVRACTYLKFLDFFKPYGLHPHSFFAAYGLAENTLAVSNYGRKYISVNKELLKRNILELVADDNNESTTRIMSCGKSHGEQKIKIVDPESRLNLGTEKIGEIWVSGPSKCLGYWNKPELSQEIFQAQPLPTIMEKERYLRTGDLGFLHQDELYICGRVKDMIIIRGMNYYPQDIEKIVEDSSKFIRTGYTAAFGIEENGDEKLVVVAGIKDQKHIPDPLKISEEIRMKLNILPHAISFIASRSIPRTSSGKIMRHKAKQLWLEKGFEVIKDFSAPTETDCTYLEKDISSPFNEIMRKYGFKGDENYSLVTALDSLDLVVFMHDIKELLKNHGAAALSKEIDTRLLQEISIAEFFDLIGQFKESSLIAINKLKKIILKLQKEHKAFEQKRMIYDSKLSFKPELPVYDPKHVKTRKILLTGGTGFLGPFILKSLLKQTKDTIYTIVRAGNEKEAMERLIGAMELSNIPKEEYLDYFKSRVIPVCGDLGKKQLGLSPSNWDFLKKNIHTIYNNGALVNYLYNYEKMRDTNVLGVQEIVKLALDGQPKILNHVSTTFIFGWAVKSVLLESDTSDSLDLLDFGYSQTKWTAEQIILDAMHFGLKARIFRPALITPSVDGGGNNFDISIRLIAFMINHGIGVDTHNQVSFTPADITANNIVAISNLPDTMDKTFHVTKDQYANMMDITAIITRLTGREFTQFKLPAFVPEIVSRCKKEDLLFPLLDFLVRSEHNISAMEFKLYDNNNYYQAKNRSPSGIPDPTLEDTVKGMLRFMIKRGIINVSLLEPKDEVLQKLNYK